jgi:hypothetical protein
MVALSRAFTICKIRGARDSVLFLPGHGKGFRFTYKRLSMIAAVGGTASAIAVLAMPLFLNWDAE